MAAEYSVLGIAAGTGRVGYALLVGGQLVSWGLSRKASRRADLAAEQARQWLALLEPEAVIVENLSGRTRKCGRTPSLISAISQATADASVICASVERVQMYKNKYEEARALARRFPDLSRHVPRRPPIWLPEPRHTIYFEALALALSVQSPEEL